MIKQIKARTLKFFFFLGGLTFNFQVKKNSPFFKEEKIKGKKESKEFATILHHEIIIKKKKKLVAGWLFLRFARDYL